MVDAASWFVPRRRKLGECGFLTSDGVFRGAQEPRQEQEVEKVDQREAIEPEEAGCGGKRGKCSQHRSEGSPRISRGSGLPSLKGLLERR